MNTLIHIYIHTLLLLTYILVGVRKISLVLPVWCINCRNIEHFSTELFPGNSSRIDRLVGQVVSMSDY